VLTVFIALRLMLSRDNTRVVVFGWPSVDVTDPGCDINSSSFY